MHKNVLYADSLPELMAEFNYSKFNYVVGYHPDGRSVRLTSEFLVIEAAVLCHDGVSLDGAELPLNTARQLVGDTDYRAFVLLAYAVAGRVTEPEVRAYASVTDLSDRLHGHHLNIAHTVWKLETHKLEKPGDREPLAALVTGDPDLGHA